MFGDAYHKMSTSLVIGPFMFIYSTQAVRFSHCLLHHQARTNGGDTLFGAAMPFGDAVTAPHLK